MSDYKQKLSAYLDDAADAEDVQKLISDAERSEGVAARYQMIGEVLRGEISYALFVDVAARVRAEIDRGTAVSQARTAQTVRRRSLFDFGALTRPMVGLAMAASVALITVVTVARFETTEPGNPAVVAETGTVRNTAQTDATVVARQLPAAVPVNLHPYMEEHAVFASQDTVMRRMPYARAVSYESR